MEEMEIQYLFEYENVDKMEEVPGIGHSRNMEKHDKKKYSDDEKVGWIP